MSFAEVTEFQQIYIMSYRAAVQIIDTISPNIRQ